MGILEYQSMGNELYRAFDTLRNEYSSALKKSSRILPQLLSNLEEGRANVGFQLDPLIAPIILKGRDPQIWIPRKELKEETVCTLVVESKLPVWLAVRIAKKVNEYITHFSETALPWDNPFYRRPRI